MRSLKKVLCLLLVVLSLVSVATPAMASPDIQVILDGEKIQFDVPPQAINQRTMVPLRAIFEALGATVDWDNETQTVTAKKGETTVKLTIGDANMHVNEKVVTLDSPACAVDGRTLVPVRAISEAFQVKVKWDGTTQTVLLSTTGEFVEPNVTMYAADGRTKSVPSSQVAANQAVGWYLEPVVTMYALDGRTKTVLESQVAANQAVGWYLEPMATMYSMDGRTKVLPQSQIEANEAVGWYYGVPTTIYDSNGTATTVGANRVNEYLAKGYYASNPFQLTMSAQDMQNAEAMHWIHERKLEYNSTHDEQRLFFGFKDENQTEIYAPAVVSIRIVNDDGECVYNAVKKVYKDDFSSWTFKYNATHYLAMIPIPTADITPGSSDKGKLYFVVKNPGYFEFDEFVLSARDLPKIKYSDSCSLQLPQVPKVLHYYGYDDGIDSSYNITNVRYEFKDNGYDNKVKLTLYFDGEKYYDKKGPGQSSTCRVGWKLYDMNGYVVEDGTFYSPSLREGEKFKDEEAIVYDLEPGAYRLEIQSSNKEF